MSHEKPQRPPMFERSSHHNLMILILPIVTVAFLTVLYAQQQRLEDVREEGVQLRARVRELEAQIGFYKKAYEITLEDIKVLSQSYGGQSQYEQRAAELREKELGTVLGNRSDEKRYTLRNERLWGEYSRQGIVNASCLAEPYLIDTIQDEVLVTLGAQAGNATLSIYVDGNFLEKIAVAGAVRHQLSVILARGEHEVSLVSREALSITELQFDTSAFPLAQATSDLGAAWGVFDCADAVAGPSLSGAGAVRARIQKA